MSEPLDLDAIHSDWAWMPAHEKATTARALVHECRAARARITELQTELANCNTTKERAWELRAEYQAERDAT